MPYTAQVFRVMIASPSDVSEERERVRDILAEWNVIHSVSRTQVLLPVGWESHAAPDLSARPQEIINKQVLKDCDLLVGVFWTRIGTSTGGHASGTVEEIEEHIALGKPVMLYFSEAPVALASVNQEQYARLTTFKQTCLQRGLIETYSDLADFGDKFRRQLQIRLNDPNFKPEESPTSVAKAELFVEATELLELSDEARQLLISASHAADGTIMFRKTVGRSSLTANRKEFIKDHTARERAIWDGVIDELINGGAIKDLGYKKEILTLTKKGYEMAEKLAK